MSVIKTRIVKFVGHIHNMQLCIEIISFINNENESLLRWFYSLCEPRNFNRILWLLGVVGGSQSKKVCSCDFYVASFLWKKCAG